MQDIINEPEELEDTFIFVKRVIWTISSSLILEERIQRLKTGKNQPHIWIVMICGDDEYGKLLGVDKVTDQEIFWFLI